MRGFDKRFGERSSVPQARSRPRRGTQQQVEVVGGVSSDDCTIHATATRTRQVLLDQRRAETGRIRLVRPKGPCLNGWTPRDSRTLSMIRRALTLVGLAVVTLGVLVGIWIVVSITTDRPVTYESIEDHFKYGSIGSEPGGSLFAPVGGALPPYWVFKSLPSICSDKLPNGY